ncbi:putative antibiotic antiporter [Streptomyces ambofaciens ATCC 23877]|uniref:MFS transporter n=2 Tax=Streptomyces ambofaciens TaxID=1889 RepID=Q0JWC5_STRAM|nr:MFS transporter [Streptomyces ambofaciens]AKZ53220.1 putative antibiotic antiporter [Streptomyces ambofaciens ATCC 23877]AKZ60543.1 putative antibiotic antiporter [Streptomyces ambofaciens ATCC 23877]ANB04110.1 MFS transporter [Streptomyces ambofaciens]ANB10730.1 MFS transporter [Streptomyces ambofaciens]CAI78070.1 putative antibiotic antiporter [Streptomyces ambofaciens ATCC 23877]
MAASDATTARSAPGAGLSPGLILAFVCMGQFMVFTDVSIVNLALPSIQEGLGMSEVSLNYIVTAYATVLGGFLLLGGRLADTFGRRRLIQVGFVIFALASLTSGLADSGTMLIASRAVQGFGAALITPAALAILTNTFAEGPERNKALGVWGSLSGIASIVGVILGGVLADTWGWEWIFWINVPIGLTAAVLAPRILPESKAEDRGKFDTVGAVTLTAGLLLLIFTLGEATTVGWDTFRTIGSLVGVVALLTAFVVIEAKVASPMMPLRIFRLKTMRVANISAVLVFGTFGSLFFFASLFMQQAFGYSPLKAGFAYVPLAFSVAAGAGIASAMVTKMAARPVVMMGLTLTVAGLLLMWRAPADGSYAVDLLAPFILLGLGCGMVFVTLQIAAFVGVTDEDAGVGAGLINTSQEAGGALGLAVVATIAYSGMSSEMAATGGNPDLITEVHEAANHDAFLSGALLGTVALLVVTFMMPRGKQSMSSGPAEAGEGPALVKADAEK